jgi:hypothetical protein
MSKNEFTVTLNSTKLDKIIRELGKVDKTNMSAGYFNDKPHPVHTDVSYPQIAFMNNYGWDKIPRRPFMSDAGQDDITLRTRLVVNALRKLLSGVAYEGNFEDVAKLMANNIKKRIVSNSYVPNAEAYKAYKEARWGNSEPLIASGNMRDNVEHKVTKKGGR